MLSLLRTRTEPTEDLTWITQHADGAVFPEIGPDGDARGWKHKPDSPVVAIELVAQRLTHHDLRIEIPEGAMAVFFRRRYLSVAVGDGSVERTDGLTVVGWESAAEQWYLVIDAAGNNRTVRDMAAIA